METAIERGIGVFGLVREDRELFVAVWLAVVGEHQPESPQTLTKPLPVLVRGPPIEVHATPALPRLAPVIHPAKAPSPGRQRRPLSL
jgi:hypothetical protein